MYKAEVYSWVMKLETDITSLHSADCPGQAYKEHSALVTRKSKGK